MGLSEGLVIAAAEVKARLKMKGFSEEDSCEVLLDVMTDFIVSGMEGDADILRERLGHWSMRILSVAAEKAIRSGNISLARPGVPPRVPFPPPTRARVVMLKPGEPVEYFQGPPGATVAAHPPGTSAHTRFTIDGKTVPAYLQKLDGGKWVVVLAYGIWQPGALLKSVEKGEYDSEEAARKSLEAAVDDLSGTMEPWVVLGP